MNFKTIILAEGGGAQDGSMQLIMFGLIAVVFYFFMIRPQMKKNKEARAFREGLSQGDKVITAGGIHGKILEVSDTTVLLSTEGSGKLRVELSSITANADEQLGNQRK